MSNEMKYKKKCFRTPPTRKAKSLREKNKNYHENFPKNLLFRETVGLATHVYKN